MAAQRNIEDATTLDACSSSSRGLLRISFDSEVGQHFDSSFVTLTGPGSHKGCLLLDNFLRLDLMDEEGEVIAKDPDFVPVELVTDVLLANSEIDGRVEAEGSFVPFLIFVGLKYGSSLGKEFKPLMHRVTPPHEE